MLGNRMELLAIVIPGILACSIALTEPAVAGKDNGVPATQAALLGFPKEPGKGVSNLPKLAASKPKPSELRLPIQGKHGKYGYIDGHGREVIQCIYYIAEPFHDGLAWVLTEPPIMKGGVPPAWSVIDKKGRILFKARYPGFCPFSEGRAGFRTMGGKMGFIDARGQVIVKPIYDSVGIFHGGRALVWRNNKWGVIDRTGHIVIPISYARMTPVHEGLIAFSRVKNGPWGYMDKNGKVVIAPKYLEAESFSGGLGQVTLTAAQAGVKPSQEYNWNPIFAYIDVNGKIAFRASHPICGNFAEGVAWMNDGPSDRKAKSSIYVAVDKKGATLFRIDADNVGDFHEGVAAAEVDGAWGYLNKTGKWAHKPDLRDADDFDNGFARVKGEDNRYGYVDRDFHYIWKSPFLSAD